MGFFLRRLLLGPSFFVRQLHIGPTGGDPFPLKVERLGLQMPKWICEGFLEPEANNVVKANMEEVIIHCDISVEEGGDGEDHYMIMGIVARDCISKKTLWHGSMRFKHYSANPAQGEMLAILVSIFTARCMGVKKIYVRNDNPDAIRILKKNKDDVSEQFMPIYEAYQRILNEEIIPGGEPSANVHLSHIAYEEEREAAHWLSRVERKKGTRGKPCLKKFWAAIRKDRLSCDPHDPKLRGEFSFTGRNATLA